MSREPACTRETVHGSETSPFDSGLVQSSDAEPVDAPRGSEYVADVERVADVRISSARPSRETVTRQEGAGALAQESVTRRPLRLPARRSPSAGTPWARATAAAASRTPKPSSADQPPAPVAVCSITFATSAAVNDGFAAQTSAAAPAT